MGLARRGRQFQQITALREIRSQANYATCLEATCTEDLDKAFLLANHTFKKPYWHFLCSPEAQNAS